MLNRRITTAAVALGASVAAGLGMVAPSAAVAAPTKYVHCNYTSQERMIRLGDYGQDVKEAQCMLNIARHYGLSQDGDFGPRTNAAVRNFQSTYRLGTDGIIGPKTWRVLHQRYDDYVAQHTGRR